MDETSEDMEVYVAKKEPFSAQPRAVMDETVVLERIDARVVELSVLNPEP